MKYFGTDGIRTKDIQKLKQIACKICFALKQLKASYVVIGKDTRKSGNQIEKIFLKNLKKYSINTYILKTVPTACVAFYTKFLSADFGIMITASHNPADYNGIKIFNKNGEKTNAEIEEKIESYIDLKQIEQPKQKKSKQIIIKPKEYIKLLEKNAPNLKSKIIVLDCANGATKNIARKIFKKIGGKVFSLYCKSGKNINKNCGAVFPQTLAKKVLEKKADIGFAFDGDGDRCVCVTNNGTILSGDNVLFVLSKYLKVKCVVGTVYSNGALESALAKHNITLYRSDVGDQEVKKLMNKLDATFGGERSGHFIFSNILPTGDGILTSLQICKIKNLQKESHFKKMPSITLNIEENKNNNIEEKIFEIKKHFENLIKNNGRIYVRKSGTENVVRVLIEHMSKITAKKIASSILKQTKE